MTSGYPDFSLVQLRGGPLDGATAVAMGCPAAVCVRHRLSFVLDDEAERRKLEALPAGPCLVYRREGRPRVRGAVYVYAPGTRVHGSTCGVQQRVARTEAVIEGMRAARGEGPPKRRR